MIKKEIKEVIKEEVKEFMNTYNYESAPSINDLLYYYENIAHLRRHIKICFKEDLTKEQLKKFLIDAIREIGIEKEKKGYKIQWDNKWNNNMEGQIFKIKEYPNERNLTEKEQEFMKEYFFRSFGKSNLYRIKSFTKNFSFKTDGCLVWVDGYREGQDIRTWEWNELINEAFDLMSIDEINQIRKELNKNNNINIKIKNNERETGNSPSNL